ncbi:hypothetical protein FLAVO9AF_240116 [Flavobacterium sp. 9AF]|nr:hypothetical protein FLAVO9AF_240116 [Flavobacterium sp. 9AF]
MISGINPIGCSITIDLILKVVLYNDIKTISANDIMKKHLNYLQIYSK